MTDLPPLPLLPVLTKAERRKNCGGCGSDIRGDRVARSSGLCATCRSSIEERGRPLLPFAECKCDCMTHTPWLPICDGQCGGPFGGTSCCFTGPDNGDPTFRALFNEHERVFLLREQMKRDQIARERQERWRQQDLQKGRKTP